MPAMRAPISLESPSCPATPATRKHHAMEVRSTSSRDRATDRKSPGRARRERTTAVATSATPAPKEASSGTGSSVFRFGRNVRKAMAHRSWKIRIPRVTRPASVPISSLSKSSLTTMRVDDRLNATAR